MRIYRIQSLLFFFLVFILTVGCNRFGRNKLDRDEVSQAILTVIDSMDVKQYFPDKDVRKPLYDEFINFYKARDYRLAWVDGGKSQEQAEQLLEAIRKAPEDGLDSSSYRLQELLAMQNEIFGGKTEKEQSPERIEKLVRLDFYMTSAYLTYASHLLAGRVDPAKLDTNWIATPRKIALAQHLEKAIGQEKIVESLQELVPKEPQYEKLKQFLAHYKAIAQSGGWPVVTEGKLLEKGSKGERVYLLRQRLVITGDLDTSSQTSVPELFDEALAAAVYNFQERNGYEPDGKVGAQTLQMMNVPVENRIDQIILNMERVRWQPETFGENYLWVNVPSYELKVYEKGSNVMQMKIIVGKEYTSTPIFSDTIEFIVFSPDWTVPLSIAREEILPKLVENKDYLQGQNMVMFASWDVDDSTTIDPRSIKWKDVQSDTFNYRIVQIPGPNNPLGQIKFMFPNKLHIYLHDTPSTWLFNKDKRSFSHGCIRVEQPAALARYLLKNKIDETEIEKRMSQPQPDTVMLPKKMPLKIVYHTAMVDEKGRINFREDIYGHDKKQLTAIEKKERVM
jgi:murein L,D-transpeptidase YcbB/YkuD